jgi:molybdenum cofactor guanylyltransferase
MISWKDSLMYNDITGVILAGGGSSRIGFNKALLKIGDKIIIEIIKNVLCGLFEKVIIITNHAEEYNFLGLKIFSDVFQNKGPLAGIHSGLINSDTRENFLISCDMPYMNEDIIEYLIKNKKDYQIVIPRTGDGVQPLCGIYTKDCIENIEEMLKEKAKPNYSIQNLFSRVNTNIMDIEKEFKGFNHKYFININTYKDYEEIKNII